MRLRQFRSVLAKTGILGVYILFLLVQLNLKYTLLNVPASNLTTAAGSDLSHAKSGKYNATSNKVSVLQQLRLNKRYHPQEVYQIFHLPKQIVVEFAVEPKQFIAEVPALQTPHFFQSPLRGPPAA